MNARTFLPLALLTPIALASGGGTDQPRFQPKAGTSLVKNFAQEFELELDEMTMKVDGKDVSDRAGQIQMALKVNHSLAVTDRYETVEGARTTKLKRTYDEISGNTHTSTSVAVADVPDAEQDQPMSSELEGTTVVFAWDEGGERYEVDFDGDEKGDAELLKDLEEDLDLRGLLPTSEVAEGDTWTLPVEAVKSALHPGGDTKLRPEGGGAMPGGPDQMSPTEMIGEPEGEFTATYMGTREVDDVQVAVIKLHFDLKSAQDMSDKLDEMKERMPIPPGVEVEFTGFDTEVDLTGDGELLWNVELGLPHGLHLSGEARTIVDVSMNLILGEQPQSMEQSLTFSGTHTMTLTTAR